LTNAVGTASSAFLTTPATDADVYVKGLVKTAANAGNITIQVLHATSEA
jgi:hypothetical protein